MDVDARAAPRSWSPNLIGSVRGPAAVEPTARARRRCGVRSATSCHRCSAPVLAVASSCPWCGVTEPVGPSLSSLVLGAWLLAGGVSLSMTSVLVDALTRAIG